MTGILRPVTALLLAAAVLLMGNGLIGVLVPLRADVEEFTRLDIGIMGSVYHVGLMAGCLLTPRIIARVGHVRAFTAFTAIATTTPLLHAMAIDPIAWALLRGLNGLCFAGLFMGIESWLNAASSNETRGRVFGAYTLLNLTVVTAGIQMVTLGEPKGFELFSIVAVLYSLAAVPVALTATPAPTPPRTARLRIWWLMSVSPAAVIACLFTGVANGAFWTLAPIYGQNAGLGIGGTALFLTMAVLSGALTQWPIGHLSDRLGRRLMLTLAGVCAAGIGILLYVVSTGSAPVILAAGAAYGMMAFAVYPLAVAHANDLVHKKRAVEVSGGLLLTYAVGAIAGPLTASAAMDAAGHGALFLHSALAHALIAAVMLARWQMRPQLPKRHREEFVAVPRTTPAAFELDPRAESLPAHPEDSAEPSQQEAADGAPSTDDGPATAPPS